MLNKPLRTSKPIPVHPAPKFIHDLIPGRIYREKSDVFIALYDGVALVLANEDVETLTRNGILKPDVVAVRTVN